MTLENIVAWLKALDPELSDCIAAGSIDGSKEKFVGVYNDGRVQGNSRICLGGGCIFDFRGCSSLPKGEERLHEIMC